MPDPTGSTPSFASLAARLVRRRDRAAALVFIGRRWPEVLGLLERGSERFRGEYPRLPLEEERFRELVLRLFGSYWSWRLKAESTVALPVCTAEFSEQILADLALLVAAQADPFGAAEVFYAAWPELIDRVAALEALGRARIPVDGLDPRTFQVKFFGAALYHMLRPLRLLPPPGRALRLVELRQAALELADKLEEQGLAPSLLMATALAYGVPGAVEAFRRDQAQEIRDNFSKMRQRYEEPQVDDVVGSACLRGCTYFAFGTLSGWLWCVQKTYVREVLYGGEVPEEAAQREPEATFEPQDREFRGALTRAIAQAIARLPEEDLGLLEELVRGRTLVDLAREAGVAPSTMMRRRDRLYGRLRGVILGAVLPPGASQARRREKVAEILSILPHLELDLGPLEQSAVGADRVERPEDPKEEPAKSPNRGCLVPRL